MARLRPTAEVEDEFPRDGICGKFRSCHSVQAGEVTENETSQALRGMARQFFSSSWQTKGHNRVTQSFFRDLRVTASGDDQVLSAI